MYLIASKERPISGEGSKTLASDWQPSHEALPGLYSLPTEETLTCSNFFFISQTTFWGGRRLKTSITTTTRTTTLSFHYFCFANLTAESFCWTFLEGESGPHRRHLHTARSSIATARSITETSRIYFCSAVSRLGMINSPIHYFLHTCLRESINTRKQTLKTRRLILTFVLFSWKWK